ncbi:alpha/beta fold hydrolase [Pseudomonas typographi]|uniref:Alpha/beta hydrolase n=1 Tax=Pseudomonas typographi TaxID=2715964 RepID=A0ABR7YWX2_9PSED|nr:alpha/beta hydrolase [Pseudomonas typographi]MBD1552622.1 alpha/beta hydrolase [Pseudomonas typographi]MBD1586203.1 alpha/beta hydrolase [Pseudomonas typographi]MBD1597674.1 alpha/beta hydrolase [Pseudomonas typographi]
MVEARSFDGLPRLHGQWVELSPGRRLNITHQPGSGINADTVVFFCHGGGGNQDQWRLPWRALQGLGYSLVAWDLLGHGLSDKPDAPEAYRWAALVDDYLRIVERYAGTRNVLVGHSFGSGLTLSAAAHWQEQARQPALSALLLLGSQLQRPLGKSPLLSLPVWLLALARPLLAKGFRERAWHPSTDPRLVAYEESLTRHNRLAVFKALVAGAQWPSVQALASLHLPIHILAGETDGLTPPEAGRALHEHLPGSQFEVLACGHQLMLEQPGEVTDRLLALLARVAGARPGERLA